MQHKHMFVLSAVYSGSTLLTALLGTSPNASILDAPEHEGMKLPDVDALFTEIHTLKDKPLPWAYLDHVYRQHWDLSRSILVEKGAYIRSAPGIEGFYSDVHFIILVRNPYAWCESMHRRHQEPAPVPGMLELALVWLREQAWQIHNLTSLQHTILITYEELCDKTQETLQKLYAFMPELEPMDASREFRAHSMLGKGANPITNTNKQAISRLNADEIRDITTALSRHPEVAGYFGYPLID